MGKILIGTASWTDPTLLASGWYPPSSDTAEERLRYYASHFNLVEVDSTYYALPSERTAGLWAERTPPGFTFNIKAFSLFTGHPTPVKALPKDVRGSVPEAKEKVNVYLKDVSEETAGQLWQRFHEALQPLRQSGKLGPILFQFPPWFFPGPSAQRHILSCREHLPDDRIAVEFRSGHWMSEGSRHETLQFLADNGLSYVCVDEPQGFKSSVPPVVAATAEVGMLRMHGRNRETWEKRGLTTAEKYRYLYTEQELQEWLPGIEGLANQTQTLHIVFNNCYRDYAVRNAQSMAALIGGQPSLLDYLTAPERPGAGGTSGPTAQPAPLL